MTRIWVAGIIGVWAIVDDLARRRISNWISITALCAGLTLQILDRGWRGGLSSGLGVLAGGGVFIVFYLLGGMGGGDVKLMAGFGAILGARGVLEASLWTAACGGVMAATVLFFQLLRSRLGKQESSRDKSSIPYAPAIAMGVWLSLIGGA